MIKLKRLTPSLKPKDFLFGGKIMSLANLFDLSGHVAVVTGGNGGIGRSIALGLAQRELPLQFWRATRKRTNASWAS